MCLRRVARDTAVSASTVLPSISNWFGVSARSGSNKGQITFVAALFSALIAIWTLQISEKPIGGDGQFIVLAAVNLVHHGSFSRNAAEPGILTMYREPLPVFATAGAVAIADYAFAPAEPSAYESGQRARWLKLQNVGWLALLCGAAFAIAFHLTASLAVATVISILSYAIFLYPALRYSGVDSLGTEISAAALLMIASYCFALAAKHDTRAIICLAGALFGALALIKASALYIAFVLALLLIPLGMRQRRSFSGALVTNALLFIASTFAVVAPWMYRNWVQFDTFAISERGGLALNHRALFNEVNAVEYRGLFYVWSPSPLRDLAGRALGFTPEDLREGGSLSRLDARVLAPENRAAVRAGRPQDATSIMAQSNAELAQARQAFQTLGYGQRAWVAADNLLRERAIERMLNNPQGALAVSFAAAWRGGLLLLPLFTVIFILAWRRHRLDLIAFCLPAFGFTAFYILFSHFEPRYGAPMTPIAMLAFAVVLYPLLARALSRFSPPRTTLAAARVAKVPAPGASS